jgi:hypothetical protein
MDQYQCIHRGKTTSCQVVCISEQDTPICMTDDAYQKSVSQALSHQAAVVMVLVMLLVTITCIMAIRATLRETRNDR